MAGYSSSSVVAALPGPCAFAAVLAGGPVLAAPTAKSEWGLDLCEMPSCEDMLRMHSKWSHAAHAALHISSSHVFLFFLHFSLFLSGRDPRLEARDIC